MRQTEIYRKDILAGILTEDGGEYRFCYDDVYLAGEDARPISLTLPLQTEAFVSPILFPFFDGLIPEGWLLDIAIKNWKEDRKTFIRGVHGSFSVQERFLYWNIVTKTLTDLLNK